MVQNITGIISGAIGVDDTPPPQARDTVCQNRIWFEDAEIYLMHLVQIRIGRDIMLCHQPRQGCAMGAPIGVADTIRLLRIDIQGAHDKRGHADIYLIKQRH